MRSRVIGSSPLRVALLVVATAVVVALAIRLSEGTAVETPASALVAGGGNLAQSAATPHETSEAGAVIQTATPTPRAQDRVDYGGLPDHVVTDRVPLPDTSQAMDRRSGIALLRSDPVLREILEAIDRGSLEDILAGMEPLEGFCGGRSGEDCAARTNANADGVYVAHRFEDGGSLAWSMSRTTMTRLLELALGAAERELALAVVDEQSWDGQTNYLLVFTTAEFDASGLSVGSDPKHGFQLRVEPSAEHPIRAFSVLNISAEPLGWVQTYHPANQSLILPNSVDGMTRIDDGLFRDSQFN